jgi:hypothetical protein
MEAKSKFKNSQVSVIIANKYPTHFFLLKPFIMIPMNKCLLLLSFFLILISCEKEPEIIDITAEKKSEKIFVCHKGSTISVSQNALEAHLKHGDTEGPCEVGEKEELIEGTVELPKSIKAKSLSIISNYGTYDIDARGNYTAITSKLSKNFLFVENENGDVLLAKLITDGSSFETINYETTAEAIIAIMPWTAFVEDDDLKLILDEVTQFKEYSALIDAIEGSLANGASPLDDSNVLLQLEAVNNRISGSVLKDERIAFKIPEVDNFVEPTITYESGNLVINNDGTTTAVWAVEVFKDNESISGELILPPNTLKFPSLSKIGDFFKRDLSSTLFDKGLPLGIPIPIEDKYDLTFKSPTSAYLFESSLARKAAYSNLSVINNTMLKALGFTTPSTYGINAGCNKAFFDGLIESIIEAFIETKEFPGATWYLDKFGEILFNIAEDSVVNCGLKINGSYLKPFSKFFDFYSKLTNSIIVVNLFADMLLLQDIDICRVMVDGKTYPCFSIEKHKFVKDQEYPIEEVIELKVLASFDQVLDENVSLAGVKVNWDVIEGEGSFNSSQTQTSNEGLANVEYTPSEEGTQTIRASIQGKDGNIIDEVTFTLNVKDDEKGISLDGDLSFGNVPKDTKSEKFLSITNDNETDDITISSITVPNGFAVDWFGGTLEPGKSKVVVVSFTPENIQFYSGQLVVNIEGFDPIVKPLSGTGVEPQEGNLLSDLAIIKQMWISAGNDVSDPRWDSEDLYDVYSILNSINCYTEPRYINRQDLDITDRIAQIIWSGNQIKSKITIPKEINQLDALKTLSLGGDSYPLPESIGELNLISLTIRNNPSLTSLPNSIGNLPLQKFYLESTSVAELPESIGNWDLRYDEFLGPQSLILTNNKLTSLPESIGDLINVKVLDLRGNLIESVPNSIGQMKALEEIIIGPSYLTSVPISITNLKNLKRLSIFRSLRLYCLPQEVWDFLSNNNVDTSVLSQTNIKFFGDVDCSE